MQTATSLFLVLFSLLSACFYLYAFVFRFFFLRESTCVALEVCTLVSVYVRNGNLPFMGDEEQEGYKWKKRSSHFRLRILRTQRGK